MKQMMALVMVLALVLCSATLAMAADNDFLASTKVQITSPRSGDVLERVIADPRAVFAHYQPAVDSTTKLLGPVRLTGPADRPIVQESAQKCVVFVCQTVDLDAEITVEKVSGNCDRNYRLKADLSHSSETISDIYNRIDVQICYKGNVDGSGALLLSAAAKHAPSYNAGIIQNQIFQLLKLQVTPITTALQQALKEKQ